MKSFTTRMCSFMEIGLSFDCGSRVEVTVEWALVFKHITLILTSDIKREKVLQVLSTANT